MIVVGLFYSYQLSDFLIFFCQLLGLPFFFLKLFRVGQPQPSTLPGDHLLLENLSHHLFWHLVDFLCLRGATDILLYYIAKPWYYKLYSKVNQLNIYYFLTVKCRLWLQFECFNLILAMGEK